MTEKITDAHVVGVLKAVVRGSGPVLDALTETDPLGWKQRTHRRDPEVIELNGSDTPDHDGGRGVVLRLRDKAVHNAVESFYRTEFPGTAAWQGMGVADRSRWWMNRVGRFTTLVAAVPGLGGVVADRFPLQDTLGAASQALVLCALAREGGVTDQVDQVRLLAHVLTRRSVSREMVAGTAEHQETTTEQQPPRSAVVGAGRALWRWGRVLRGIVGELDKRPHGGFITRLAGKLPVVGIAGDYFAERSAMRKAAHQGQQWMRTHRDTLGEVQAEW